MGGKIDADASPEAFANWQRCIDSIARCPNVYMKVGGAQQRLGNWEPTFHINRRDKPIGSEELCELLYPYYSYTIETFGRTFQSCNCSKDRATRKVLPIQLVCHGD